MPAPTIEAARKMGETGAPASEAERRAFEAWMSGHCWMLVGQWDGVTYRSTVEHGSYVCPETMRTRMLWAAWRDRAALCAASNDA